MPHDEDKLTPADPPDLAEAVAFALRFFEGRKRDCDADAFRTTLAAARSAPSGARRLRRQETSSRRHSALAGGFEGSARPAVTRVRYK